jgi:hypothetical protein
MVLTNEPVTNRPEAKEYNDNAKTLCQTRAGFTSYGERGFIISFAVAAI